MCGFFNVPYHPCNTDDAGDRVTVYSPYPRRLERLTICRCNYKGSTFSSVILRPWVLVRLALQTVVVRFNLKTTLHPRVCILCTDACAFLTCLQSDVMVISLFSTPENGILIQDFFPIDSAYFSEFCSNHLPLIRISSLLINSQKLEHFHIKKLFLFSPGLLGVQVPYFYLVKKVGILTIPQMK